jgi:hypothetical protein
MGSPQQASLLATLVGYLAGAKEKKRRDKRKKDKQVSDALIAAGNQESKRLTIGRQRREATQEEADIQAAVIQDMSEFRGAAGMTQAAGGPPNLQPGAMAALSGPMGGAAFPALQQGAQEPQLTPEQEEAEYKRQVNKRKFDHDKRMDDMAYRSAEVKLQGEFAALQDKYNPPTGKTGVTPAQYKESADALTAFNKAKKSEPKKTRVTKQFIMTALAKLDLALSSASAAKSALRELQDETVTPTPANIQKAKGALTELLLPRDAFGLDVALSEEEGVLINTALDALEEEAMGGGQQTYPTKEAVGEAFGSGAISREEAKRILSEQFGVK